MENVETKYTKEQILNSKRYRFKKDVVNAVLKDAEAYTIEEVDKVISDFYEREV